jgi:hypothetical protein
MQFEPLTAACQVALNVCRLWHEFGDACPILRAA